MQVANHTSAGLICGMHLPNRRVLWVFFRTYTESLATARSAVDTALGERPPGQSAPVGDLSLVSRRRWVICKLPPFPS